MSRRRWLHTSVVDYKHHSMNFTSSRLDERISFFHNVPLIEVFFMYQTNRLNAIAAGCNGRRPLCGVNNRPLPHRSSSVVLLLNISHPLSFDNCLDNSEHSFYHVRSMSQLNRWVDGRTRTNRRYLSSNAKIYSPATVFRCGRSEQ